jgi:hypothetical protein
VHGKGSHLQDKAMSSKAELRLAIPTYGIQVGPRASAATVT